MKKEYISPEFEFFPVEIRDVLMSSVEGFTQALNDNGDLGGGGGNNNPPVQDDEEPEW